MTLFYTTVIFIKKHMSFLDFVENYVRLKWEKGCSCYYNYQYWICLNMPECAYINRILSMPRVLNIPQFWLSKCFQYDSTTEHCGYARIYLDRVLNISWVLNMLLNIFWIWQGAKYANVTHGSKCITIWLNMSEWDVNMPEYIWIYDNRQAS